MESNEGFVNLRNVSYNYVKSVLFGFRGWDKYILTEDIMLKKYLTHLIAQNDIPIFFEYKIIYIGGANNVVDLMNRNNVEEFFSSLDNVISVLDGDKKEEFNHHDKVFFIPFDSVEKQLYRHYTNDELDLDFTKEPQNPKELYYSIKEKCYMTDIEIFDFINTRNQGEVENLKNQLIGFIAP